MHARERAGGVRGSNRVRETEKEAGAGTIYTYEAKEKARGEGTHRVVPSIGATQRGVLHLALVVGISKHTDRVCVWTGSRCRLLQHVTERGAEHRKLSQFRAPLLRCVCV